MAGYLTAQLGHALYGLGMGPHVPAHLEEGGQGMVLLQHVQDGVGPRIVGTVVKGKGHHGLGRVDHPDVGLLRLRDGRLFRLLRFVGRLGFHRLRRSDLLGLGSGELPAGGRGGPAYTGRAGEYKKKGQGED